MNSSKNVKGQDIDWNLVDEFTKTFEPTEDDLNHNFSYEQLEELCLRVPCRVLMSRWNAVDDFANKFSREGRLQSKTIRQRLKLLTKAVNRHKEACVYKSDEKQPVLQEEWLQRKKDNILRLEVFEYDRNQILTNNNVEISVAECHDNVMTIIPDNTDNMVYKSENISYEMIEEENRRPPPISADWSLINITENSDKVAENEASEINDSVNSQLMNDFLGLNTESMTLNTHSIQIDSQDDKCSQEVFYSNPSNYDDFNNKIPLTSTQSQSQPLQTQEIQ